MSYAVKEIFYTLQGEGARAGRPSVFLRFAGCNLWTGREKDRKKAICQFCDTDFVGTDGPGGGKYATPEKLAEAVARRWPADASPAARPYVVCTGGEPFLQLNEPLIQALKAQRFEVAVETNGTIAAPPGVDWLTVSPKAGAPLVQTTGQELKLVYPQVGPDAQPERFAGLLFENFYLQGMDSPQREKNVEAALAYCLRHPQWKLSVQTHKMLNIA
jgi:7-carboxy-7-deazaguanine synthase